MTATPIGTEVVTAISRRYIMPEIADNVYQSNAIFFRLNQSNRKMVQGGTQIELPLMYQHFSAGGFYSGYDQLDVSPSDTVQNCAFNWKQAYVPVSVDGLTLLRTDSPEAIANFISFSFAQAEMELADILGNGIWSDGVTIPKSLDGLTGAVDNGATNANYGGISRASNTWWQSQVDSTTAAVTLTALQALFGSCVSGGRHPTIIASTQGYYNQYWNLNTSPQRFPVQPGGQDEQLAQAGFTNLLFSGVPWIVDSHISPTSTEGKVFFLNESYFYLIVAPRADFKLEDFQTPIDQDAMVSKLLWAGDLCCNNVQRQGKFTALT
ncbi:MAG: phage major capsid protein [Candidatus Micrarchaeaceae archaeon]